ncbi:hypothetical protein RHABOEDO_001286 [Candidatus Rhabdochlamydia oedothoracis]|uniref:Transposase DDE domain-containing protein n=1 Tax=Candidatus Rhabdochlamydia oedothoracis TaxID=2720720 RepID=A0ABX8V730_9BACT|nr:hypothetical protein RHOW815_000503 [Candidatus Rhabdochlamydia sp. W815]QYF49029.1 hypothetical protein RHABOEDO_001286 [Candidatus Rhabdochlamydia oedothoracis]
MFGVKNVLADGGYPGEKFAKSVQEILGCIVEIAKRNTLHTFTVIPKRWVVERSFALFQKYLDDYERGLLLKITIEILSSPA